MKDEITLVGGTYRDNHNAHLDRGIPAVPFDSGPYTYCLTACIHQHGGNYCGFRTPKGEMYGMETKENPDERP